MRARPVAWRAGPRSSAESSSDLVFAVGSIPAVFAVTTDPFIVYSAMFGSGS